MHDAPVTIEAGSLLFLVGGMFGCTVIAGIIEWRRKYKSLQPSRRKRKV